MNTIIYHIKSLYIEIYNLLKLILYFFIDFSLSNLVDFLQFLIDKNIIQLGIGLVLASQMNKIIQIFNDYIFTPLFESISPIMNIKISNIEYNVLGINFKIGPIIIILIQFVLTLFMIYLLWKLTSQDLIKLKENLISIKTNLKN